ncbi:transposase [Alcaligenes aquatilis]|uniref:Transposase n=1 Tax=Alcaligenes aquatilis TaxID=323284 RepID=A0A3G2HR77_9BURK|nr:transposase [Alcaligenes aquatilis]
MDTDHKSPYGEMGLSRQLDWTVTGVMETKQRDRRRSLDTSASTVTLLEVDQNVSKVFAMAQERPISVYRYRTPYAVVVSTTMWLAASKLEDFVPPHSPLTRIKEYVDFELQTRLDEIEALSIRSRIGMKPEQAIRALLLQVMHSIQTESALHGQIMSNMVFRWFVGLQVNAPLWDRTRFTWDLRKLLECVEAVELLLDVTQLAAAKGAADFNINVALARSWALRHARLRQRVPVEDYPGGPFILMPACKQMQA